MRKIFHVNLATEEPSKLAANKKTSDHAAPNELLNDFIFSPLAYFFRKYFLMQIQMSPYRMVFFLDGEQK